MSLTPRQRRALLKHGDCAHVARLTGHSAAHVHYVLQGVRRSAAIEKAFAKILQRPLDELFPALTTPRRGQ